VRLPPENNDFETRDVLEVSFILGEDPEAVLDGQRPPAAPRQPRLGLLEDPYLFDFFT